MRVAREVINHIAEHYPGRKGFTLVSEGDNITASVALSNGITRTVNARVEDERIHMEIH